MHLQCKHIFVATTLLFLAPSVKAQIGYPENIVSFAPIVCSENGFGSGLSWEHFLLPAGWLSFTLPITATVNGNVYGTASPMVYFNPGIKVYTNLNSYRKIKYSIGPSIIAAAGKGRKDTYYRLPSSDQNRNRFLYGFMLNGGYNLFPNPQLYLGADIGLGVCTINEYDRVNQGFDMLVQASIKVGYRFSRRRQDAPVD